MVRPTDLVVSLRDVDRDDVRFVGRKAADLGEMIEAKLPVSSGFAITIEAYKQFLKENMLDKKIEQLLSTINYERQDSLNQVASHIRKLIRTGRISDDLSKEIFDHYESLGKTPFVTVSASTTSEDSKDAYSAQNETEFNVNGEAVVVEKVKALWASLFETRLILHRHEKKISFAKTSTAIIVQRMIISSASGVVFTVDPVSPDKNLVIVEAVLGSNELMLDGKVIPDYYEVEKKSLSIIKKQISEQNIVLLKKNDETQEAQVSKDARIQQKITDQEVKGLVDLALKIEKHYYFPQEIRWARDDDKLIIIGIKPITTIGVTVKTSATAEMQNIKAKIEHPLLIGSSVSSGIVAGNVKKINTKEDLSKIKPGDILVTNSTTPGFLPAMKRASAVITEELGKTSHAATAAKQSGSPYVAGVPQAMKVLKDGDSITVNGKTGEIFKGGFLTKAQVTAHHELNIKTATKLFVNVTDPDLVTGVVTRHVDGVGLLRAEHIISKIGVHPKKIIHDGKSKMFVDKLAEGIEKVCQSFFPRPVFYRSSDFKTNEYRDLIGGKAFEPVEQNPNLGYRGAYRYLADPKVFELELAAIKKLREKEGLVNLSLMIPFVRSVKELEEVKKIIVRAGLKRSSTFKLYMMCETPASVILIDDFIDEGIDGVSINSSDLTMLMLGVDHENSEMGQAFDERNRAVLWAFERVISACHKKNVEVSICGDASSIYPTLVEDLVGFGIDSVSVESGAIENIRRHIYRAEERVLNRRKK